MSIDKLVDVVLHLTELSFADPSLPFVVLEDSFESLTIRQSEECMSTIPTVTYQVLTLEMGPVFEIMEERGKELEKWSSHKDGRRTLLRFSLEILRRLHGDPSHTPLRGRVHLFLANVIPLSDRSGKHSPKVACRITSR